MILVRTLSMLVAILCFYIAYMEPNERGPLILGGLFFALMSYWSIRNKGTVDGPYLYFAAATTALSYTITGLIDGQYTWRSSKVVLSSNPEGYWTTFCFFSLLSLGTFIYAFYKLKKQKHA